MNVQNITVFVLLAAQIANNILRKLLNLLIYVELRHRNSVGNLNIDPLHKITVLDRCTF